MRPETIHEMNDVLDIANEAIEEDKDFLAKIEYEPTSLIYTGNQEDLMEDYAHARDTLKSLISSGEFALTKMEGLLKDNDSPRTFEVFSTLIKSIAELTADLINLQKQMKDIVTPQASSNPTYSDNQEDEEEFLEITSKQLNKFLDKNKNKE